MYFKKRNKLDALYIPTLSEGPFWNTALRWEPRQSLASCWIGTEVRAKDYWGNWNLQVRPPERRTSQKSASGSSWIFVHACNRACKQRPAPGERTPTKHTWHMGLGDTWVPARVKRHEWTHSRETQKGNIT